MATPKPFPLISKPGVKRDGTQFESENYSSSLWNRFTPRGLPKKMNGYQAVTTHLPEKIYGMNSFSIDLKNYLHLGSASFLTQVVVNSDGTLGTSNDRTPAGFAISPANLWQIRAMQNKITSNSSVIAHAGQNLLDIASSVNLPIYYGDVASNTPLVASLADPVSGGVMILDPYMITFGNGGFVGASPINDPTAATAGSGFVTAQKVVAGLPVRGSGGPAGLLWSLDSLIQMTFDPNITTGFPFDFNTISGEISILSSQSVIEFDGIYYWAAVDRFNLYNGIVRELPNDMNLDFFFDNLNFTYRQKAFAFKVPRWGEIWFCAPLFGATECNWAVIYNTRLQTWYDTPLPDGGRTAGIFAKVYQRPFMCDIVNSGSGFTLWQHETGLDRIVGTNVQPIQANFQTREFCPLDQGDDKSYHVEIVESDFVQSGDMTIQVSSRANARSSPEFSNIVTFPAVSTSADDQVQRLRVNGRLMSFIFESNTPGGSYYMGKVFAHIEEGTGRITK